MPQLFISSCHTSGLITSSLTLREIHLSEPQARATFFYSVAGSCTLLCISKTVHPLKEPSLRQSGYRAVKMIGFRWLS